MKLNIKKLSILALMGFGALGLTGCETEDDNKIAEAQACLDAARSSSDATVCVSKVDGIESAQASLIRCGGTYLQQSFTTSKFTNAYNSLKNAGTGNDPMMAMLSNIAFTGSNPATGRSNTTDANYVAVECKKSGSSGLTWLSSSTKIATTIYATGLTTGDIGDPDAFEGAIASADSATLGQAALDAYDAQCAGSSQANTAACAEYGNAVTTCGNDPTCVGDQLKTLLQN